MNHADYQKILDNTIEQMRQLGTVKGGEYAGDGDRLANFKRNARNTGTIRELVWLIYCAKHMDSINQYISDLVTGKTRPRAESLAGRADDIIVYMVLFKCLLKEREQEIEKMKAAGVNHLDLHEPQ